MGISEAAEDFSIIAENIVNSSVTVPTHDMPAYQPGAVRYEYTNRTGATQINVTGLQNSELEFTYVR